jgi:hypothetical protein
VAGAAVDDAAAVSVDDGLDRGGGQCPFHRSCVQTQDLHGPGGFLQGADGGGQGAAEHAHHGGRLQAVADDVADRDGEAAVGQVHHVVPVAAYVESLGGGQVAHRDVVVPSQVRSLHHGLLEGDGDLPFFGMGLSQSLIQPLEFLRPHVEFGLQGLPLPGCLIRPQALGVGEYEIGHVLHPVQDPCHLSVRPAYGDVGRGSPPFLEQPRAVGHGDVELLHHQRLRFPRAQNPVQGGSQVPHPLGIGVCRILGERVEEKPPDQVFPRAADLVAERLVDIEDH